MHQGCTIVDMVMNLWVPWKSVYFFIVYDTINLSTGTLLHRASEWVKLVGCYMNRQTSKVISSNTRCHALILERNRVISIVTWLSD
jgi:hypothetical protein